MTMTIMNIIHAILNKKIWIESNSANSGIVASLDSNTQEDTFNKLFYTMSYFEDATLETTFTKADHCYQEIDQDQ